MNLQSPQEDKREWSGIWRSFKNDPLQPVRDYFHQYVITGIGLFLEGYVVRLPDRPPAFSFRQLPQQPLLLQIWVAPLRLHACCA